MKTFMLFLGAILALPLHAAEESSSELDKIETLLKAKPDDPALHQKKCQALFAGGKEQQAVDHAAIALEKFKAAKVNLPWIVLGSFKTDRHRIDVHFNMGRKERAEKRDGIVRPLSFYVWTLGADPVLVRIVDFELGYSDGTLVTAAVGEMIEEGHANFGIVDPKIDFATLKKKILEVVE